MPRHFADPQRLITSRPVVVAGRDLICERYSHPSRPKGCRVILREPGTLLLVYDTDNCVDAANCENKVHVWEEEQLKTETSGRLSGNATGAEKVGIAPAAPTSMTCSMSQSDIELSREALGMRPKLAKAPAECPF